MPVVDVDFLKIEIEKWCKFRAPFYFTDDSQLFSIAFYS